MWRPSELTASGDGATGRSQKSVRSPILSWASNWEPARAIKQALQRYERALAARDAVAVLAVYGADPVIMPQNAPAIVGRQAVLRAYEQVFLNAAIEAHFEVYEAELRDEEACVRASCSVRTTLANGEIIEKSNYELFVFGRDGRKWRIHRHICDQFPNSEQAEPAEAAVRLEAMAAVERRGPRRHVSI